MNTELKPKLDLATQRAENCRFMKEAKERLLLRLADVGFGGYEFEPCIHNDNVGVAFRLGVRSDYLDCAIGPISYISCASCLSYEP